MILALSALQKRLRNAGNDEWRYDSAESDVVVFPMKRYVFRSLFIEDGNDRCQRKEPMINNCGWAKLKKNGTIGEEKMNADLYANSIISTILDKGFSISMSQHISILQKVPK